MSKAYRPLTLRTDSVLPQGPRMFNWTRKEVIHIGGPGVPPPGFVGGQNSASEWFVYWALFRILTPELDPRQSGPPFYGTEQFSYQKAELGSHSRALGSAVADFVVHLGAELIILRLQSAFFHLLAPASKQALDSIQLVNLMGMNAGMTTINVVDLYEQSFFGPGTEDGQAVIVVVKEALGLIRRVDPLSAGVARVVRNPTAGMGA